MPTPFLCVVCLPLSALLLQWNPTRTERLKGEVRMTPQLLSTPPCCLSCPLVGIGLCKPLVEGRRLALSALPPMASKGWACPTRCCDE